MGSLIFTLGLLLGLYLGGMIPLLANECLDSRTDRPVDWSEQLYAAATWPLWIFKRGDE